MKIKLVDIDSKIPNYALMKVSSHHKTRGDVIGFNIENPDLVYVACVFTKNRKKALAVAADYKNRGIEVKIGGTGINLTEVLPPAVERCSPDYDLYTMEQLYSRVKRICTTEARKKKIDWILNAGMGFLNRGCIRNCGFCAVPKKEGMLRPVGCIDDLINPRSKNIILFDNNLTADPKVMHKLTEIKRRDLRVDITQGIDIRLVDDDLAKLLSEVKLKDYTIHYAWDLISYSESVLSGIAKLLKYMNPWKHMCFVLVGYNTTFEEDMYRAKTLIGMKISPLIMRYQDPEAYSVKKKSEKTFDEIRRDHFARWINGRFYKVCEFTKYDRWVNAQRAFA